MKEHSSRAADRLSQPARREERFGIYYQWASDYGSRLLCVKTFPGFGVNDNFF